MSKGYKRGLEETEAESAARKSVQEANWNIYPTFSNSDYIPTEVLRFVRTISDPRFRKETGPSATEACLTTLGCGGAPAFFHVILEHMVWLSENNTNWNPDAMEERLARVQSVVRLFAALDEVLSPSDDMGEIIFSGRTSMREFATNLRKAFAKVFIPLLSHQFFNKTNPPHAKSSSMYQTYPRYYIAVVPREKREGLTEEAIMEHYGEILKRFFDGVYLFIFNILVKSDIISPVGYALDLEALQVVETIMKRQAAEDLDYFAGIITDKVEKHRLPQLVPLADIFLQLRKENPAKCTFGDPLVAAGVLLRSMVTTDTPNA